MNEDVKGLQDFEPELPEITTQQNTFVKLIFQGYSATDAYIEAYGSNGSRATVYVEASRLLKNPKITPWLEYYRKTKQEYIKKSIQYSVDDAFNEFEEMKLIALESRDQYNRPNIQAANKAIEMKCKLKGLMSDDVNLNNSITMQMGDIEIDGVPMQFNIGDEINDDNETETAEDTGYST